MSPELPFTDMSWVKQFWLQVCLVQSHSQLSICMVILQIKITLTKIAIEKKPIWCSKFLTGVDAF